MQSQAAGHAWLSLDTCHLHYEVLLAGAWWLRAGAPSLPTSSGLLECRGPSVLKDSTAGGEEVLVSSLENSCF